MKHLFFDCPEVNPIFNYFFNTLATVLNDIPFEEKCNLWFGGPAATNKHNDNCLDCLFSTFGRTNLKKIISL
jgi:hypothetical protein